MSNKIKRKHSCYRRFCLRCAKKTALERDMTLFPSIKQIVDANKRDPKNHASLWFVTLTVPTCTYDKLPERINELQGKFREVYKRMKDKESKAYFNAIRKLEVNPNPIPGKKAVDHTDYMYHAHLHVLIQGLGNANELRRRWLKECPNARKWSQSVIPFDRENGTLEELLKYISKPVVSTDKESRSNNPREVGMAKESTWKSQARRKAMVYIYDCLKGRRTIFSYGTIKKKPFDFKMLHNEAGELLTPAGYQYFKAADSLTAELAYLNSLEGSGSAADKNKIASLERQLRRIENYLYGESAEASRPLQNTLWEFINGHYVDKSTGEQMAPESDVEQAAKAQGKKQHKAYKANKTLIESIGQKSIDKVLSDYTAAKAKAAITDRIDLREYAAMAKVKAAKEEPLDPTALTSSLEPIQPHDIKYEMDHSLLYFKSQTAYEIFLVRKEKKLIELGLAPPLKGDRDEFEALMLRGRWRQKTAFGGCRERNKRKQYFVP